MRSRRCTAVLFGTMALPLIAIACGGSLPSDDENWPHFLGPAGIPVVDNPALPDSWSRTENVEWSAEIAGTGWSSPIIWGNRVFLTAATSEQPMKQPRLGVDFGNNYIAELRAQGADIVGGRADRRRAWTRSFATRSRSG